ncbi:uncharacterized protein LOC123510578 [Portunus trituberculatus]|uniref:uncharacterized protein LOC123510578 n=1 Tax=Portunus trituberculatus TaxID=210409 RepID=UPI001E1D0D29|nr:uncharacterized protein LOC123510578 [Portunus trituberculatus]
MAATKAALHKTSVLFGGFAPKNLLGVCEDEEGHILVSFRSFVKRFNIADRQQVRNWTTKSWHPFTCAAVYQPEEQRVVAAVNGSVLAMWSLDHEDLDSSKRSSFETPIHTLLTSGNSVFVVFTTGHVERLSEALLASRKTPRPGFLSTGETITYVEIMKESGLLVMVVKKEGKSLSLYRLPLGESVCQPQDGHMLALNDAHLTGICATSSAKLVTLWSTGQMYIFEFHNDYLEKLPGRLHATEQKVTVTKPTKILELSPSHVVIVGQDRDDEGGVIVLRDIKFGLVTSTQPLKMYHRPPPVWLTRSGLVVVEGGSLALIPFTVKESNLATVFGSRIAETKGSPFEECHSWARTDGHQETIPKEAKETIYSNKSAELMKVIGTIDRGALSESMIAVEVIGHLIEVKRLNLLREAMDAFVDVPEISMVDVLTCYLGCQNADFEGLCQTPYMQIEYIPQEEDGVKIVCPFQAAKAFFINGVLKRPFTDVQLLAALPKMCFDHALNLIKYLHFLIAAGEVELIPQDKGTPSLSQTALWLSLLLETNYHQLVMSSEVAIHRLLLSCFTQVSAMIKFLEGMSDIELLVRRIVKGQPLSKHTNTSAPYSLERLVIT